jgi:TP901 family phage tail tape measure protein
VARGKSVIQVVITGEARGLRRATNAAAGALGGFALAGAKVISMAASLTSAIGVASVKAFADFDAAMTQSLAIMGNVSQSMEADMAAAARQVAKTTTFSAEQAAESYFFLASAGLDAAQSIQALPKVAQFAQAGMFDMALATDLLTDAQSALGLTIRDDAAKNMENMAKVADVLVKANTLANASVQQFSESLTNKAGAALDVANKGIEEGVAVLAAFADQGVKGAEAGERLSVMLRDITRAGAANADEFAKLGLRVFDAEGNLRNMADVIGEFERVLGPMSDAQKAATLDTLGLTRSVADNIKLVLGASQQIRDYEKALLDAGGTTEEVAEKQLQTFNAQMQLFRSGIGDAFLTIGGSFQPALDVLASFLTRRVVPIVGEMADKFAEIAPVINDFLIGALGDLNRSISNSDGFIAGIIENGRIWMQVFRDDVLPILQELWEFISGPLKDQFIVVRDFVREELVPRFSDFAGGVRTLIDTFTEWYRDASPAIITAFNDLATPVLQIYDNLAGIVTGIGDLTTKFNDAQEPGGIFAHIVERVAFAMSVIAGFVGVVTEGIRRMTDALNDFATSSGLRAIMDFTDRFGGGALSRVFEAVNPFEIAQRGIEGMNRSFARMDMRSDPGGFGAVERQLLARDYTFTTPTRGGDINITVNTNDPQQVVDLLKRYARYNGPISQWGIPID